MKFNISCPRDFSDFALSERCRIREDHIKDKKELESIGFVFTRRLLPGGGDIIDALPVEMEITKIEELISLGWGDILICGNDIDIDHVC